MSKEQTAAHYVGMADETKAVAPIGYIAPYELGRLRSGHNANIRSSKFGPSPLDGDIPVYAVPQEPAQADTTILDFWKNLANERATEIFRLDALISDAAAVHRSGYLEGLEAAARKLYEMSSAGGEHELRLLHAASYISCMKFEVQS